MVDEERTYIIPLRKEWLKVARYSRSKKAVYTIRSFIQKHMKVEDVRIGKYLNMKLWSRGMKKPPHKVAVKAVKVVEKEGSYVKVDLVGAPEEKPVEKKKKSLVSKLKETVTGKEEKPKVEKESKKEREKLGKKEEQSKEEVKKEPKKEEVKKEK